MKTCSEFRAVGRATLSGRWNEAALLTFVYIVIAGLFNAIFGGAVSLMATGAGSLLTILLFPMAWGFGMTFLALSRNEDNDPFEISHLFDGYRGSQTFRRIFLTELLRNVYILLWTLLLIVPGIVKALAYSLTPYILRDYPELENNAAIELSMQMMQGRKMKLFLLELSFIGWAILSIFTFCIGFFWLVPYMQASLANFYEDAKSDYELING